MNLIENGNKMAARKNVHSKIVGIVFFILFLVVALVLFVVSYRYFSPGNNFIYDAFVALFLSGSFSLGIGIGLVLLHNRLFEE